MSSFRDLAKYELQDGITVWEQYSVLGTITEDDWLIHKLADGRLRVAVLDGVTSLDQKQKWPTITNAAYATSVVRGLLRSNMEIIQALDYANAYLHKTGTPYAHGPACCVMVVDIYEDYLECIQAGDCGAWFEHDGAYEEPFELDCFAKGHPKRRPLLLKGDEEGAQRERHNPDNWTSHPIGGFAKTLYMTKRYNLADVSSFVISTDGSHFDKKMRQGIPAIEEHLKTLREHQLTKTFLKPNTIAGDHMALIHMQLAKI